VHKHLNTGKGFEVVHKHLNTRYYDTKWRI